VRVASIGMTCRGAQQTPRQEDVPIPGEFFGVAITRGFNRCRSSSSCRTGSGGGAAREISAFPASVVPSTPTQMRTYSRLMPAIAGPSPFFKTYPRAKGPQVSGLRGRVRWFRMRPGERLGIVDRFQPAAAGVQRIVVKVWRWIRLERFAFASK